MMMLAQTNIQLYNQLCSAGWAEPDLARVRDAYEAAMSLFAGHFRPNHKPFLAHLVGVAGILAAGGADSTIVAAGLLHSAYPHGEFGDRSRGITERKRRQLLAAVGAACEAIIARYATLGWNLADIISLVENVDHLTLTDEAVVLIRLADVLEDHLDRGMQYSPNKRVGEEGTDEDAWRKAVVRLADVSGHQELARELERVLDPADATRVPALLHGSRASSFVVGPRARRAKSTRLARALARLRETFAGHDNQRDTRAA